METLNNVFLSRSFACEPEVLFNWLSKPELLLQWFGPKGYRVTDVMIDLQLNGQYLIELQNQGGKSFFIKGEYLEIDKPNRLVFSYAYEGLNNPPPESVIEINISRIGKELSNLKFKQQFSIRPSDLESRTQAWTYMLELLNQLIVN